MNEFDDMMPVLQQDDLDSLEAAKDHLENHGFRTMITPFQDLPESERLDWMIPEEGGYLLWVDGTDYEQAMDLLGRFYGYSEDIDEEEMDIYFDSDFDI